MAVSINWATKTFSVPQADLTLVSGSLYELSTETYFRSEVNAIMAGEDGIVFPDSIDHNTDYTVAGVTYARKIEMINSYKVEFTPDSQYSVRLAESNNNIFDVEAGVLVQNQVQVIPQNSAGLITVTTGSGLDAGQDAKLTAINNELINIEGTNDHSHMMRGIMAMVAGVLSGAEAGKSGTAVIKNMANSKTRLTITFDAHGNRTSVTYDDLT